MIKGSLDSVPTTKYSSGARAEYVDPQFTINTSTEKFIDTVLTGDWRETVPKRCFPSPRIRAAKINSYPSKEGARLEGLVQGLIDEITPAIKRKKLESIVDMSRLTSPHLFEYVPFSLSLSTPDGRYLDCNESFADIMGYSKEELMNLNDNCIFYQQDEVSSEKTVSRLPNGSFVEQFQIKANRKDATQFWAQINRSKILDVQGNTICVLTQVQDISKIKEAQQNLEQKISEQTQDLTEARTEVNRLQITANHETRNALNAIVHSIDILEKGGDIENSADLISTIHASSHHLLNILNQDLDYLALKSNELRLHKAPFSLANLLSSIRLGSLGRVNSGVSYSFAVAETVPDVILGDAKRIRQVLESILANSVEFTKEGEITVNVTVVDSVDSGDLVIDNDTQAPQKDDKKFVLKFEISDTGEGIPVKNIPLLFHPYEKGVNGNSGVGLGLAISKGLVELMGGGMLPVLSPSTDKGGSRVSFCIEVESTNSAKELELDLAEKALRNKRFLIVDDAPLNRRMLANVLMGGKRILTM